MCKGFSNPFLSGILGLRELFFPRRCVVCGRFLSIDEQDLCYQLFTEAGFEWGGSWTSRKDYQHFEYIEKE